MGTDEFISKAKNIVDNYIIEHIDKTDKIRSFDIFVVRDSIDREYIENDNKILQDYINNESEVK